MITSSNEITGYLEKITEGKRKFRTIEELWKAAEKHRINAFSSSEKAVVNAILALNGGRDWTLYLSLYEFADRFLTR